MRSLLLTVITAVVLSLFVGGCSDGNGGGGGNKEKDTTGNNNNAGKIWDGTADVSWYDESKTEFTITTAEQLAGLAKLVNDEKKILEKKQLNSVIIYA